MSNQSKFHNKEKIDVKYHEKLFCRALDYHYGGEPHSAWQIMKYLGNLSASEIIYLKARSQIMREAYATMDNRIGMFQYLNIDEEIVLEEQKQIYRIQQENAFEIWSSV